jgi:cystathionine beta-lyase/cystathionine gamma-synthase
MALVYAKYGIKFKFMNSSSASEILGACTDKTRMLWIETPTNPLLNILDIKALADGKPDKTLLVVDNTFATPYFQQPMALGADIVVHSVTKYIAGHSDVVGGAVVTNDDSLFDDIKFYQNAAGGTPGPMDCFLVQRGAKTLGVRMDRHFENAKEVAGFLRDHSLVERTVFGGFEDHPGYEIASRQMTGQPGMVSFFFRGSESSLERFFTALNVFTFGESLGGVESLACYPYTMTHGIIPDEEKNKIGISRTLVRLSVGIEDVEDIMADLDQALKCAGK